SSRPNWGWKATASRNPNRIWVPVWVTRSSCSNSFQFRSIRWFAVSPRPSGTSPGRVDSLSVAITDPLVGCGSRAVVGAPRRRSAADGLRQLCLVHLRPALDPALLRLVVQLVPGPALAAAVRTLAAAVSGRNVFGRGAAGLTGLATAGPHLVHRPGGDLLGDVLAPALVLQALLDVVVLTLTPFAPRALRHRRSLASVRSLVRIGALPHSELDQTPGFCPACFSSE